MLILTWISYSECTLSFLPPGCVLAQNPSFSHSHGKLPPDIPVLGGEALCASPVAGNQSGLRLYLSAGVRNFKEIQDYLIGWVPFHFGSFKSVLIYLCVTTGIHRNCTHKHSHTFMLTWPVEQRCVSAESCLCSSERCGSLSAVWSSHPNHCPRNEPHNSRSCQCLPSPNWPPLLCVHCLKGTCIVRGEKQYHTKEKLRYELYFSFSRPSYLCPLSSGVCELCWKHLSCTSGGYAKENYTRAESILTSENLKLELKSCLKSKLCSCECMCMLTPSAARAREGQTAALSSGTCPVSAADDSPSSPRLLEEYPSAESKCSSWPSDSDVLLQTGTVGDSWINTRWR